MKEKIPNDSIPFEALGESLYEKESREAEKILAKERAARKALAKHKKKSQQSDSWQTER
jgi:hypothetical protein